MQIARLIAQGCGDREIAGRLGISYRTVRTHLERLYERFGIHSRTQAALLVLDAMSVVGPLLTGGSDGEP